MGCRFAVGLAGRRGGPPPPEIDAGVHTIRGWGPAIALILLSAASLNLVLRDAVGSEPKHAASARAALSFPIVVCECPVRPRLGNSSPDSAGMLPQRYDDGARILWVEPSGSARVLVPGLHSAADPNVSFDGKRILLAGKRTAADRWAIYEWTIATGRLRQVVRTAGDCRSPSYQGFMYTMAEELAWPQITFVQTDAGVTNEYGRGPASSIWSCKLDGSFPQRLTYNLSSDFDPAILPDGRLVFAAWRRAGFDHGLAGRVALMGVNTDGIDLATFCGDAGRRVQHSPCATASGLVVFVEADTLPWDGAGTLSCVSLRRPLHSYRPITAESDGLFHSPSALPDGRILVSRRPADGSSPHAVWCLDPATRRLERVFADPGFHCVQAQAVVPRPEPDGRSSALVPEVPLGKFYCLDVTKTEFKDRTWFPRGTAKKVRVLEGIPRRAAGDEGNPAGLSAPGVPQLAARRILGEAPVAGDGSFNVEVPANTPIQLQLLDERGMALRSCGWIWTRNHESQGCIGCHEDPELTPTNLLVDALAVPTVSAAPPPEKRPTIDFRRDVMPIVQKKCAGCHGAEGSPPRLDAAGAGDVRAKAVYEALLAREEDGSDRSPEWKFVEPGKARTSPLAWHVEGVNTSRPWDGPAASRAVKAIPPGKAEPLSAEEKSMLVRWIDLGARWEGVAAPASK